ncbi:phospholipase A [Sphingomonas sp. CGMCC 1.13654]|uniref:Phospholipase A1 n=1 Tax=Sphingomonas chungangi TaxID=2683589 RepID=A0A838L8T0_9SPHN|nr:phospholipase A [Sphingomonas chungangi]MBA2935095.1 phospholipase A [Sphingomonas chungangi]MVW54211.1 phospholipase [Sphingomonas chungangi]
MSIVALSMALLAAAPPPPPIPLPPLAVSFRSVQEEGEGPIVAHVILLNTVGGPDRPVADTLYAILHADGRDVPVEMKRQGPPVTIAGNGYAQVDYAVARPAGVAGRAVLSVDSGSDGYAFALGEAGDDIQSAQIAPPTETAREASAAPVPPPRPNNPLLGNLSTYNPIYAVLGHGTDTDAKLELSFKYQLLGHPGDGHWYSGFHFAYTQRMFWDLGANSAPFRDVNYQPEFLYIYTLPKNEAGDQLNVRGGYLHESNGRDGSASRSYNILYIQPTLDVPIGSWTASIGPRIFHYIINRDGNEDIARYRGHQALAFSIGQDQGLKLSTWSRLNFSTGKGSVDADLSYPLTHIWHDLPLYVVVQGFTGYGEDLLDYNRKQTRLRVGIGIVR